MYSNGQGRSPQVVRADQPSSSSIPPANSADSIRPSIPSGAVCSTMPSPRPPGRSAWQCKPLAVDETSHAANISAVKGGTLGSGVGGGGSGGVAGYLGGGGGGSGGVAGWRGRERATVRLGMHWFPAAQLVHYRGVQVRDRPRGFRNSRRFPIRKTRICGESLA